MGVAVTLAVRDCPPASVDLDTPGQDAATTVAPRWAAAVALGGRVAAAWGASPAPRRLRPRGVVASRMGFADN